MWSKKSLGWLLTLEVDLLVLGDELSVEQVRGHEDQLSVLQV
jgi:hypothetical protein